MLGGPHKKPRSPEWPLAKPQTDNGVTYSWVTTWGGIVAVAIMGVLFVVWAAGGEREKKRKRRDRLDGEF